MAYRMFHEICSIRYATHGIGKIDGVRYLGIGSLE